jgi:hypothetical protein
MCIQVKTYPGAPTGEPKLLPSPPKPGHTIGVDFLTGFPKVDGNDGLKVIVNHHMKRLFLEICSKRSTLKTTLP